MSWTAPDCRDLLRMRLEDATSSFSRDTRLQRAVREPTIDSIAYVRKRVRKRMADAAASAVEAVEATLRASATEALLDQGLAIDDTRAALDEAGAALHPVDPVVASTVKDPPFLPVLVLGLVFWAWATGILFWWSQTRSIELGAAVGIAAAGVVPAAAANAWRQRQARLVKQRLTSEYPEDAKRHYLAALATQTTEYESRIQAALRGTKAVAGR